MAPREFWHCTPRKLAALSKVHADLNTPDDKKSKNSVPVRSKGGVGVPDTFVDQINLPK